MRNKARDKPQVAQSELFLLTGAKLHPSSAARPLGDAEKAVSPVRGKSYGKRSNLPAAGSHAWPLELVVRLGSTGIEWMLSGVGIKTGIDILEYFFSYANAECVNLYRHTE